MVLATLPVLIVSSLTTMRLIRLCLRLLGPVGLQRFCFSPFPHFDCCLNLSIPHADITSELETTSHETKHSKLNRNRTEQLHFPASTRHKINDTLAFVTDNR